MKVLVYEHICATYAPKDGPPSLQAEGRAMLSGVLRDLVALEGVGTVTCLHPRQPALDIDGVEIMRLHQRDGRHVAELAARTDAALVIAPETAGTMLDLCQRMEERGVRLLGPDSRAVAWCTDKLETARRLGEGLAIPTSSHPVLPTAIDRLAITPTSGHPQFVLKPRDGAGSLHTAVTKREGIDQAARSIVEAGYDGELIVQPFWPGLPASIGIIRNECAEPLLLPAALQVMQCEPSGGQVFEWLHYAGGSLPLASDLDQRARRLAKAVLAKCSEGLRGYFGIDLVLGPDSDGSLDRVIEINPRLTTSYVGYRSVFAGRIGYWLLGMGDHTWPAGPAPRTPIRFDPQGHVFPR